MNFAVDLRAAGVFFLVFIFAQSIRADVAEQSKALEQLRREIAASITQKSPAPIKTVLKRYKIHNATAFSGAKKNEDSQHLSVFLPARRPAKISLSEWQALKNSDIQIADSENNSAAFILLDLDEDGLRDLIVDTYTGGTGLFSYVYVYRQKDKRFTGSGAVGSADDDSGGEFYSISGRGADQEAEWIRLKGRVYLAYREGEYGSDRLFLRRAFAPVLKENEILLVEYNYRHSLPPFGKFERQGINAGLYAALQKSLARLEAQPALERENTVSGGKCPLPQNLSPEQREQYSGSWFGPAHYTFDVVADFPVFEGGRCYEARLVSFKNSYPVKGQYYLSTSLWLLRRPEAEQEEFEVVSKRTPRRVSIARMIDQSEDSFRFTGRQSKIAKARAK